MRFHRPSEKPSEKRNCRSDRRTAATLIELSVVICIFLFFFFGVLEYARLCFVRNLVINAAREGARYAVVNANASNLVSSTQARVRTCMCGFDQNTTYYNCQVYLANSSGTNIGNATDAGFGEYIAVQVDLDYKTIMPSFLLMNQTIRITSKDMMYSEAN